MILCLTMVRQSNRMPILRWAFEVSKRYGCDVQNGSCSDELSFDYTVNIRAASAIRAEFDWLLMVLGE